MTDFALAMSPLGVVDLAMVGLELDTDDGLETAVIVSLFTDRHVDPEELPLGESQQRGWWGDVASDDGYPTGSRLWLLQREKAVAAVAQRAKDYCAEALEWMVDDGVTTSIDVEASISGPGVLTIEIDATRPQGNVSYRYDYLWQQQEARRPA